MSDTDHWRADTREGVAEVLGRLDGDLGRWLLGYLGRGLVESDSDAILAACARGLVDALADAYPDGFALIGGLAAVVRPVTRPDPQDGDEP